MIPSFRRSVSSLCSPAVSLAFAWLLLPCLAAQTVFPKWTFTAAGPATTPPALLSDGTVVFGSHDGRLYALAPEGTKRWEFATPREVYRAPLVGPDDTIYFGSSSLCALRPDGTLRWEASNGSIGFGTPVLALDGTAVAVGNEGRLYAVRPNGTVKWSLASYASFVDGPVIGRDGAICVALGDGVLLAYNPDGAKLWEARLGYANVFASPVITGTGAVLVGLPGSVGTDSQWFAVNPDGSTRWTATLDGRPWAAPAVGADDRVYLPLAPGALTALKPNGVPDWTARPGGELALSPTLLADGTILVSADKSLYALSSQGAVQWTFEAAGSLGASPAVAGDGTIYCGDASGQFYALSGSTSPLAPGTWARVRRDLRNSASVEELPVVPGAPSGVTASQGEFTDKVTVSWSSVRGASDYELWRGTSGEVGSATKLAGPISGAFQYEDRSAVHEQPYFYFVRAQNGAGFGPFGAPATGVRRLPKTGEAYWIQVLGDAPNGSPAVGPDGAVYAAARHGQVYAVGSDGQLRWTFVLGGRQSGSPTVAPDGTVYCAGGTRTNPVNYEDDRFALFAVNPGGSLRWQHALPGNEGALYGSASDVARAADGTLVVAVQPGQWAGDAKPQLVAVDPEGARMWAFERSGGTLSAPSVAADGTVYAASLDGWVGALSPEGKLRWSARVEDGYLSAPIFDADGVMYAGGASIWACNPDGQLRWSSYVPNGAAGKPFGVAGNGTIYCVTGHGGILAYSPLGGPLWAYATGGYVMAGGVVASDGTVIATTSAKAIIALAPTGTRRWEYAGSESFATPPVLGDNQRLFAISYDGRLHCVRVDLAPASSPWPQTRHDASNLARATQAPPVPAIPTAVTATKREHVTHVQVSWASVKGASSYAVFRSIQDDPTTAELLNGTVTGQTSFSDLSAVVEVTYRYWVKAQNMSGASDFSASASGTRRQAVPGDALFKWDVAGPVNGSPAIAPDGSVYVSAHQAFVGGERAGHKLVALGPAGAIRWEYSVEGPELSSSAIGADGTVYFGVRISLNSSAPSPLIALNPDGTRRWEFTAEDAIVSPPAIGADGTLYFGSRDYNLYALTPGGELLWRCPVGVSLAAPPVIGADAAIYIATCNARLVAVNPDGTPRWSVAAGINSDGDTATPAPALADGALYVPAGPGGLVAVNLDGTERWRVGGASVYASPVIDRDGNVLVGNGDSALVAIRPNGAELWRYPTGTIHRGAAVVGAAGAAYTALWDGRVVAVATNGSPVWTAQTGAELWSSPALAPDGTLYVGGADGKVRSFFTGTVLADSDWPMFQRDLRHTGRETRTLPLPATPANLQASDATFNDRIRVSWASARWAVEYEVWRHTENALAAAALVAEGVTGTNVWDDRAALAGTNYFYWIRAANAAGLSEFTLGDAGVRRIAVPGEVVAEYPVEASTAPALGPDGAVYVGTGDWMFNALDPDLTLRWRKQIAPGFSTPAVLDDGAVCFWASDSKFYVLNADGTERRTWNGVYDTAVPAAIAPDGALCFGDRNRNLYVFNPDGTQRLQYRAPARILAAPVIGTDGAMYFGADDSQLYAVNPDGTLRWTFHVNGVIRGGPAIGADGTLYFGSDDRGVYAVSFEGRRLWAFQTGNAVSASPVIGPDGTVFVGSRDNTFYAIRPDGAKRWSFATGGMITAAGAVAADGTVYFGSGDKRVYALSAQGTKLWEYAAAAAITEALLLDNNGRLLVATGSRMVALHAPTAAAEFPWPQYRRDARRTGAVFPPLVLSVALNAAGEFVVAFTAVPGRVYQPEATEDLRRWQPLGDPLAPSTAQGVWTNEPPSAAEVITRYFRLRLLP